MKQDKNTNIHNLGKIFMILWYEKLFYLCSNCEIFFFLYYVRNIHSRYEIEFLFLYLKIIEF